MKINSIMPNRVYNAKAPAASSASVNGARSEQSPKMDTITLNLSNASRSEFSGLVRQIAGEVLAYDSPTRVENLRAAVGSGSYQVSTDAVTRAIIEHAMME